MKNNKYTKYIFGILLVILLVVYIVTVGKTSCEGPVNCFLYMTLGSPYQYYAVPLLGIVVSLLPYLFLKKKYLYSWLVLLVISIPLISFSIITAPENGTGNMIISSDREAVTYFITTIYTTISWLMALWGFIKEKQKKH